MELCTRPRNPLRVFGGVGERDTTTQRLSGYQRAQGTLYSHQHLHPNSLSLLRPRPQTVAPSFLDHMERDDVGEYWCATLVPVVRILSLSYVGERSVRKLSGTSSIQVELEVRKDWAFSSHSR